MANWYLLRYVLYWEIICAGLDEFCYLVSNNTKSSSHEVPAMVVKHANLTYGNAYLKCHCLGPLHTGTSFIDPAIVGSSSEGFFWDVLVSHCNRFDFLHGCKMFPFESHLLECRVIKKLHECFQRGSDVWNQILYYLSLLSNRNTFIAKLANQSLSFNHCVKWGKLVRDSNLSFEFNHIDSTFIRISYFNRELVVNYFSFTTLPLETFCSAMFLKTILTIYILNVIFTYSLICGIMLSHTSSGAPLTIHIASSPSERHCQELYDSPPLLQ